MIRKLILFSTISLGLLLPAAAQKMQLSIEGGYQQSLIFDEAIEQYMNINDESSIYLYTWDHSYNEKPSAYLKGMLTYAATSRVQLYQNFSFNLLRYESKVSLTDINYLIHYDVDSYFPGNSEAKTSLLYLTQEIGARYKIASRLWLHGGVDVSYRLYANHHAQQWINGEGGKRYEEPILATQKDKSGAGFNALTFGIQAGAAYELSKLFSLTLGLQHSLTPLYNHEDIMGKGHKEARVNQLRLGVQYKLMSW